MKTLAIVQARMDSTRLPGKVMMRVAGRPLLGHVIERLQACALLDGVLVATTTSAADDPIVSFCQQRGIETFQGSERDVLQRYRQAADVASADLVVRITADCPLTDPALVDAAVATIKSADQPLDYVSNALEATYPVGTAVEVMTIEALRQADDQATLPAEREHVTPYLYGHPELFRTASLSGEESLSHHRWTVDTQADFDLVLLLLTELASKPQDFSMQSVLSLFESHPDWMTINHHVVQRSAHEFQDQS